MRHAVVIGGGIGGLCAARVLSERFAHVTVIDRDVFPRDSQHRKGVPQSRHPHALLDGGRRELERLFPGFVEGTRKRGALELDPGCDMAVLGQEGWGRRRRSTRTLLFASRVLIEGEIRELAKLRGNIVFRENTDVVDLLTSTEGGLHTVGVQVRDRDSGETADIAADLVVDASGRSTRAPEWLKARGLPAPPMTVVDADAGYSTRWYRGPSAAERPADWWWKCLWLEPLINEETERQEELYFGVLFPVEDDCWIVTVASWGGRPLPKDEESFESTVANLRSPLLAEAIAQAEPISPVYYRRAMQNRWLHYEQWAGELPGFIATADAACGFNPVYGQGMTSAAFCAGVLERCLKHEDPTTARFAKHFFAAQAEFLQTPWMMAVSRDRQQARTVGMDGAEEEPRTRIARLLRSLGTEVLRHVALAGRRDPAVGEALFDVVNLSRTPASLVRDPVLLVRILRARLLQTVWPSGTESVSVAERPPAPDSA
jgi:2-polyprenyl-6-methoxyphenol hydroxylase-like FAD-dependent oxidoreductase